MRFVLSNAIRIIFRMYRIFFSEKKTLSSLSFTLFLLHLAIVKSFSKEPA